MKDFLKKKLDKNDKTLNECKLKKEKELEEMVRIKKDEVKDQQ